MKRRFTLVEIMIVATIIAIIGSVLMGAIGGIRKKAGGMSNPVDADTAVQVEQERAMQEIVREIGIPAIKNWQEKRMLKMLYELRDREDLICYAYLVNEINGQVGQYLGKCIGYGLPDSTQFSNPEKETVNWAHTGANGVGGVYGTLPQAEPNGLFMPEGLSATWLMMIDPKDDKPRPVYIEPSIIVSPFPLHE